MHPLDYLAVGHITKDLTPTGPRLGGTVSFAALTASALGLQAGIVTSISEDMHPLLEPIADLQLEALPAPFTSTFENIYRADGRLQILSSRAYDLPLPYIQTLVEHSTPRILHVGPLTNEIDLDIASQFPDVFVGITPQGWMRAWDADGIVTHRPMLDDGAAFISANAVVMSIEDIDHNEHLAIDYASQSEVLVVTRGEIGCTVFVQGAPSHVDAIRVEEVEPTGAGDVFAAAFFTHFSEHNDPLAAARFAAIIAGHSVRFAGLGLLNNPKELKRVVALANHAAQTGLLSA